MQRLCAEESFMSIVNIVLVVIMFLSAFFTCILILMHSGKGTGVSELIASSMYNSAAGSAVWEKNLDRLTVICGVIFGVTVLILSLTFPLATI